MTFWSAVLLGVIQGLTEFLPVSSSGHLAIFQAFFGLTNPEESGMLFDIMLHLGTLIAVVLVYWKDIIHIGTDVLEAVHIIKLPEGKQVDMVSLRIFMMLVVSSVVLFIVLPFRDSIEQLYNNTFFIAGALAVTGLFLFLTDHLPEGKKDGKTIRIRDALLIGFAEAFATFPGVSRSGATISASLACGLKRTFVVEYSFLLSIPAILAAVLLNLVEAISEGITWSMVPLYLVGIVVSAGVGYLSLRLLKYISEKGKFSGFSYYCWGVAAVTLILSLIG